MSAGSSAICRRGATSTSGPTASTCRRGMEPQAECMLVLIGATPEGKKELVGFQVGMRESAQSWRELLVDLKARGLAIAPELATGDGALGFWKALEEVSPTTRHQRCTVHKTVNVLDKLPKSVQPAAKADLREIWTAPDRTTAEAAIASFAEKYGAKYEKAVTCLVKDRDALLTFYDFPAEHWDHLRTSNPIESVFATVRHRTVRTKGALSQDTARLMVFKLVMAAAKTWRRLKGENQLPKVIDGVRFKDGIEVTNTPSQGRRLITPSPTFLHSSGSLGLKLFSDAQASISVPSTEKCSTGQQPLHLGRASTAPRNRRRSLPPATGPGSSRTSSGPRPASSTPSPTNQRNSRSNSSRSISCRSERIE